MQEVGGSKPPSSTTAAPIVVRRDKSDPALRLGMTRLGRKPNHLGLLLDYRHSCFGYLPRSSFLMLGYDVLQKASKSSVS